MRKESAAIARQVTSKLFLGLVASILLLSMASATFASLNQFSGQWKNIDSNTRGVTSLNISVSGTRVTVQAWGKCHPKDCDWGRVNAYAYGPDVSSNLSDTAKALSAVFESKIRQKVIIIHALNGDQLQAEVLTHFYDTWRRGRTDYMNIYTFVQHKAETTGKVNKDKEQAAKEIIRIFWKNTLTGNYKQAEKYLSKKARAELEAQGVLGWEGAVRDFTTVFTISNVRISSEPVEYKLEEGTAILYVSCEFFVFDKRKNERKQVVKKVKLVDESGNWKIEDPL